ncbi:hypothetical protein PS847_00759 [Pseudomonas fluorescens]|uniref:Uncharacterized protein n=1 Tax=Pseudomonas fluorescens TaxID=294 RepID=A0A5E7H835_PSEFL|nr:hypothetical protein PS847_00759 [Pseudomonas fluorescens]
MLRMGTIIQAKSVFLAHGRDFISADLDLGARDVFEFVKTIFGLGLRHVLSQVLGAVLQRHHGLGRTAAQRQQGCDCYRNTQHLDFHTHL